MAVVNHWNCGGGGGGGSGGDAGKNTNCDSGRGGSETRILVAVVVLKYYNCGGSVGVETLDVWWRRWW